MQSIKELLEAHKSRHNCDTNCQYPTAILEVEKEFKERIDFLNNELKVHKQICMCAGCVAKRRKTEILKELLSQDGDSEVRY